MAEIGTPEWWLARLHKQLNATKPQYQHFSSYYEGEHNLVFATKKFREAFGDLFKKFADNWCDLVVDAVEERMDVEGFRIPNSTNPANDKADDDAWSIWQANELDANSQILHTEAFINACSYAIVWNDPDKEYPYITVESPEQVTVAYEPGTYVRAAALKEWWDDWTGYLMATLYMPDAIYKYQSQNKVRGLGDSGNPPNVRWVQRTEGEEAWPLPNPLQEVPVIPFENRPRLIRPPVSELKKVIPVQDAINKLGADLLVASEFEGFRQRWATGIEIPTDPQTGQPVDDWQHAVNRLWTSDSKDTKFGDFSAADLRNFTIAIDMYIQHIASQTRTPPHYFYLRGEFPSGESIKSAETGLVAKARRRMRVFGESWEKVMRLAFKVMDDPRADVLNSETIWGDPESRSESEHVDATMKKRGLGIPLEQLWEDLGYTPQQIERFKEMRKEEMEQLGRIAALQVLDPKALAALGFVPPAGALPAGGGAPPPARQPAGGGNGYVNQ